MAMLAGALERARALTPSAEGRRARHRAPIFGIPWAFEPWWAQRMFLRPIDVKFLSANEVKDALDAGDVRIEYKDGKPFRIVVAGRQSGKTEVAARKQVQVMGTEPGSYSALLAPTYKIAQAAIDKVLSVVKECNLEAYGWVWREQKKRLEAPNGSVWAVFSADRGDGTIRGPTVDGILWIDEGAFLSEKARDAAYGSLVGNTTGRVMITTTPCGMNWVHREWTDEDPEVSAETLRIRFRSADSPFSDKAMIRRLRKKLSKEKGQQEFDAEFVASLFMVFPPDLLSEMWVDSLPRRDSKTARNVIGFDLGKYQDYCVPTLGNRFGEYVPLGRWKHAKWPDTNRRAIAFAQHYNAITVVDVGVGGGYGDTLADALEEAGCKVIRFKTAVQGQKSRMVEGTKASAEYFKVKILKNDYYQVYNDELSKFQGLKRTRHGVEYTVYEGPQIKGEHDDCPISLCLTHWGVNNAYEGVWEDTTDPSQFLEQPGEPGSPEEIHEDYEHDDDVGGDFPSTMF